MTLEELEPIEQDDLPIILEVARNAMKKSSMRGYAATAMDVPDEVMDRAWVRLEAYCAKTSGHGRYEITNGREDTIISSVLSFKEDELDAHVEECVTWLNRGYHLKWVEAKPKKKKK